MFHFCKNSAVIFAFLCMPFIWRSQCAVQMFHCQTLVPPNLLCDPWLVTVPLGNTTPLPVTKHTKEVPGGLGWGTLPPHTVFYFFAFVLAHRTILIFCLLHSSHITPTHHIVNSMFIVSESLSPGHVASLGMQQQTKHSHSLHPGAC